MPLGGLALGCIHGASVTFVSVKNAASSGTVTYKNGDDTSFALLVWEPETCVSGESLLAAAAAGLRYHLPRRMPFPEWWARVFELTSRGLGMPVERVAEAAISWLIQSQHREETVRKYANEIGRFLASSRLRGAQVLGDITEELVGEYLDEPIYRHNRLRACSPSTRRFRLSSIHKLYAILRAIGISAEDPAAGVQLTELASTRTRPLTHDEIERVRESADRTLVDTLGPATIALAEAGGKTGEIAAVVVGDLDFQRPSVLLGGGTTRRANTLSHWGTASLLRHLEARSLSQTDPVLVGPTTLGYSATASVSQVIREVIRHAGLAGDPHIRPESIRAWSGRNLYETTGDLVACARWLGLESLDTTADLIGLSWRER